MPRPGVPDPYRQQARKEGYLSRAVYKLKAMDAKHHLFRPGQRVLDLGCSPGSWLQYIISRVGQKGLVVGVDLTPPAVDPSPIFRFLAGDVESLDLEALRALCPHFEVVVSDLAPKTTGVKEVDHQRSLALARRAWEWAQELLVPGGHFLVKIFEGSDSPALAGEVRPAFELFRLVKPPASRQASREIYLLGLGKRPA